MEHTEEKTIWMKLAGSTLEWIETNLFEIADLIAKFHSRFYILDVMRSFFYFVKNVPSNTNISQQFVLQPVQFPSSSPLMSGHYISYSMR
jgi:hypothetical protein